MLDYILTARVVINFKGDLDDQRRRRDQTRERRCKDDQMDAQCQSRDFCET